MTGHDDSASDHAAKHGSAKPDSATHDFMAHDFMALYRELGVDATCTFADLRAAWRRRVSKLHPDQGGRPEDIGRLQELNRRYDAAVAFHARFGRLPGAPVTGTTRIAATDAAPATTTERRWQRADAAHDAGGFGERARDAAGLSTIARCFVAIAVIAVVLLGWRLVDRSRAAPEHGDIDGAAGAAGDAANAASAARPDALAVGMDKDMVRRTLGEPIDMHALRWHYGPSWVDFRCDRVAGWYSSPLRPLRTATARREAPPADDTRCD